jgi:AmiR/NasT family two-component response regulator
MKLVGVGDVEDFAHAATELEAARDECEQLQIAMEHRTVIGQTEGILMERLGIDADQAFAYLRRMSQCENRKLISICHEIVKTRRLPPFITACQSGHGQQPIGKKSRRS